MLGSQRSSATTGAISLSVMGADTEPPLVFHTLQAEPRNKVVFKDRGRSYMTDKDALKMERLSLYTTDEVLLDSELIAHLHGRMEGQISWRINDGRDWVAGYCFIDNITGSLVFKNRHRDVTGTVLIHKLNTSYVQTVRNEQRPQIEIRTESTDISLRPPSRDQHEQWLAALLYWQRSGPAPKQLVKMSERNATCDGRQPSTYLKPRHYSDSAQLFRKHPSAIVKAGRMLLYQDIVSSTSGGRSPHLSPIPTKSGQSHRWRPVSCILREDGQLHVCSIGDASVICVLQLAACQRTDIQLMERPFFGQDYCIGVFPNSSNFTSLQCSSAYLAFESKTLYEVWFVLMKCFSNPEFYVSPSDNADSEFFRQHTSIQLCVKDIHSSSGKLGCWPTDRLLTTYCEVLFQGEVRGRTPVITSSSSPQWNTTFVFGDVSPSLSKLQVLLRQPASSKSAKGYKIGCVDCNLKQVLGDFEGWVPMITSGKGGHEKIGGMLLCITKNESIVLASKEYSELAGILHDFSNGITYQLSRVIADLTVLADTLLKIFQSSGVAVEWILTLAKREIDRSHEGKNMLRFSRRLQSNDSSLSEGEHQDVMTALGEANVLFRGNSLLTKVLDAHMKLIGSVFLEGAIGSLVRNIASHDIHCEVDPAKLSVEDGDLNGNWRTLLSFTCTIWKEIFASAQKCPPELREIFAYIRVEAEDMYGEVLPSIGYTTVSGFIFLRFFCPAILNPKLFSLLQDQPGLRARRTLTLIAKGLQGFANLSRFGAKEPWMERMNEFIDVRGREKSS